ncbi:MAG: 2-oxoacid:ferredoxin oxidoreductase subunit beta [Deltaproteobacteria bacterium]|nr:2-oxoacid:ferredoxin oxidoreductase subunit beta [Candidatus Anaeroferrophillus wilburensis]MBN2888521.1 2-oxoacid:ferredoxin oxidoreductase subunit beta [Deltaproteobacteria bacterium]
MISNSELVKKYCRHNKKFPHIWCPGCGNGIILSGLLRAIDGLGLAKDDIAFVSGIGCSSRAPVYVDFNTLHTTHGRALAFATGLKLAKPKLNVIIATGDGDATAIGGNHFIHACRRNIDMTAIIFNNYIYGMTGGQYSPTTPHGAKGSTCRAGNIENPFNISALAEAAGASFVARTTSYHVMQLQDLIKKAIRHRGFSVVEVLTHCPTLYGRLNKVGGAPEMLQWQKEVAIPKNKAASLTSEELEGKVVTGVLVERDLPEYGDLYNEIIREAQQQASGEQTS